KKDLIQVNGIKGHIKLDKKFGCEGTIISPKFVTTTNVHESSPVDSLIYSWGATPFSSENLLENYATPAPSIQLSKAGLYNISMRVTNSTGCRLNISSDTIQIGIKADFNANKYELCVNDTVLITSNSTSFINFREWTVSGDGQFDFDTLGKFIPHENGQYKIRLIAGYNQQCFDTITKDFQSVKVTSRFNTFNSDLLCAPAYAQFVSESQNADSLFWDFGDGTNLVTTDLSVATIYQRNTVPGKGYVVSLIAHNELGCADTFVSPYPVNVIGPQPKIQLENFNGCEPLNVRFKHQHSGATSILLNFRDGSELDTSITNSHVYFVKNGSLEQKFIPSVYAIDSLGCSAIAESKDTIVVRKSPILPGLDTALSSCFPGNIDQNYFDPEVLEYRWNLNDSFISHKPRVIQSDLAAGTYKLELQVFNQLGCSDTNIRTFQIHPLPEISLNDGNFCLNVPGTLSASITNNNPDSLSWKWFMESPDSTYESHTNSCLVTFSVPDNHRIIVEATDQNQCMGHASNRFLVHSPDSIPVGSINYTTFNEANDLLVNWDNNTSEFVASQQLIDGNGNLIVGQGVQSNPEYRLTYKGIIPTVCFRLLNADDCGYQGMPSGEHCAMILRTATPAPYTVSLNWSRYAGWDNIAFQLLYRKKANGAYEEVAKLDGNALSYTDSMLCDDSYIYFIEAHHADGRITQSNRSLAKPKYISNELPIDVEVVSVKNEAIEVSWLPAQSSNIQHYRLEKMDSTGFYVLDTKIFDAQTTNFLDQNVQVNDASYRYRLTSTDHCGSESNPGLYGKSILLRAQYSDHKSTLTWNSYEQWQDGVKHYLVQLKTPNGYETLATVPGNVLYYTDREVHKEVKGEYCYRICAVSYFDGIQSLSNQVCIFGESFMWIPNAFSPNEDDLNTVFRPTANFINMVQDGTYQTYEMKIYNRWGELLFRTTDINEGWDGSYRGEQTPPSSYVYHIRAKGLDNVIYNYKGTIRLMR
ncbi:MAG: gliding motility-associated C-terminal domain-containing protein, partial [Bacteroidetes bacterium]|nr:gliding motility-associated C-terminal domain-containing protein [Bacteroidota bacterium]